MKRITSIQIDWFDCGLTCGEFIVHQRISVSRNKKRVHYWGYNAVSKDTQKSYEVAMNTEQCELLFLMLEQAERNRDFEQDFYVHVCDGAVWEMRLRHSDNRHTLITGSVEYPAHGKEIEAIIKTAFDDAFIPREPVIFGCTDYDETE